MRHALPCRRFAVILADANARLGANADCYSFIAVDLHHLLFAGFYRRTESLTFPVMGVELASPETWSGVP
jgi:hypothetical protein